MTAERTGRPGRATSPYVLGVGGTSLTLSSSGGYGNETAWSASGTRRSGYSGSTGGVSTIESLPSYQAAALGSSYVKRATPDVSLNANPGTGLSVYDSVSGLGQTGWFQVGGTSAGAPIWAGPVAAADQARVANHLTPLSSSQTLNLLYGLYRTTSESRARGWAGRGSLRRLVRRRLPDRQAVRATPNRAEHPVALRYSRFSSAFHDRSFSTA